jgi:hypothetical protein
VAPEVGAKRIKIGEKKEKEIAEEGERPYITGRRVCHLLLYT